MRRNSPKQYAHVLIILAVAALLCTAYHHVDVFSPRGQKLKIPEHFPERTLISSISHSPSPIEAYTCTNITSKGSPAPTPFKPTTLDLSCSIRGTCDNLYLFIICPPFSGSTALYSLLSTSKNAVTLLESGVWGGEGLRLYYEHSPKFGWERRWEPDDAFFDASLYSDVIREAWESINPNATVFVEKSPPNIIRTHNLYNQFRSLGRVRFVLMMQNLCIRRESRNHEKYVMFLEYAHLLLAQYKEITFFLRYEELLLNLDKEVERLKAAFPELEDIDPSKDPVGAFGDRSTCLKDYIQTIDTIMDVAEGEAPYLRPRKKLVSLDSNGFSMARDLDLL